MPFQEQSLFRGKTEATLIVSVHIPGHGFGERHGVNYLDRSKPSSYTRPIIGPVIPVSGKISGIRLLVKQRCASLRISTGWRMDGPGHRNRRCNH